MSGEFGLGFFAGAMTMIGLVGLIGLCIPTHKYECDSYGQTTHGNVVYTCAPKAK